MSDHACPICDTPLESMPRYPHYVCETCASRAASADGRKLRFSNEGLSGGYVANYADTGESYDSHACWIDGVACHADEARFGGHRYRGDAMSHNTHLPGLISAKQRLPAFEAFAKSRVKEDGGCTSQPILPVVTTF